MLENFDDDLKESIPYVNCSDALFQGEGWQEIGKSVKGELIRFKHLRAEKEGAPLALLIGGVHGNETEGVRFMEDFTREFALDAKTSPFDCSLILLPVMNPDGFLSFRRQNENGVDLNRNMPSKDWAPSEPGIKYYSGEAAGGEPETQALVALLEKYKPDYIISFHSWKPMLNINGPSRQFGETIGKDFQYPIEEDIGYPTPGSLGTYAGLERGIPTITLEFERGLPLDTVYQKARRGVIDSLALVKPLT